MLTQFLTFLIDFAVIAATELDTLERAWRIATLWDNLFQIGFAAIVDYQCLPRSQFLYIACIQIESGL